MKPNYLSSNTHVLFLLLWDNLTFFLTHVFSAGFKKKKTFSSLRNGVGTRVDRRVFHSFFEFSQTLRRAKENIFSTFDHQNVTSLCSCHKSLRHHYRKQLVLVVFLLSYRNTIFNQSVRILFLVLFSKFISLFAGGHTFQILP